MISDQCTYTCLHHSTPFYAFVSHILTLVRFPDFFYDWRVASLPVVHIYSTSIFCGDERSDLMEIIAQMLVPYVIQIEIHCIFKCPSHVRLIILIHAITPQSLRNYLCGLLGAKQTSIGKLDVILQYQTYYLHGNLPLHHLGHSQST